MAVVVETLEYHTDARGMVFEPLKDPVLGNQKNVHVVTTQPGGVRGNHRHLRATEVLVTQGPARVRYRDQEEIREVMVGADKLMRFTFPAGVSHAVENTGTQPQVLVSFSTQPYNPQSPDVVTDVLLPVARQQRAV